MNSRVEIDTNPLRRTRMEEITKIELDEDDQVLGVFVKARVVLQSEKLGELVLELYSFQSVAGYGAGVL